MEFNKKKKILFISDLEDEYSSFNLEDESYTDLSNSNFEICNLIGCCNGIICLQTDENDIVLLNPSTREFKVLPPFTLHKNVRIESKGFGYDNLNNDYKVILILSVFHNDILYKQKGYPYTMEIAVYSVRSNSWKKLKNKNTKFLSTASQCVRLVSSNFFFNGRVHWDAYDCYYNDRCRLSHYHPMIFSMDLSGKAFRKFQYPSAVLLWENKNYERNLQVIGGFLSVILFQRLEHISAGFEQYVDIWSMKEYGVIESWSRQYRIGPFISILGLLSIRANEDEDDHLLLQMGTVKQYDDNEEDCEFIRWNLSKNEQVQKYYLQYFDIDGGVLCYTQSLVSITKEE